MVEIISSEPSLIDVENSSPAAAPSDSAAVRRRNLGLVLRHIAANGPCARTEIAAATGLSHASVTGLVADLAVRGLVREDGVRHGAGRGRPRRLLRMVAQRALTVAVQISLEQLRVAVADLAGRIVWRESVPHRSAPGVPQDIADAVAAAVRRARAAIAQFPDAELARLVIAMAGPVGVDQTVIAATDFGWLQEVRLGTLIAAALPDADCPLDVINDANAAALAEYHAHPQRPRGLVYIEAGTGIGGGVVLDGRIHTGSHGIAGEPGHMPVALDGPDCSCGARGCLVCYAGPEAVLTAAGLGAVLEQGGLERALARFAAAVDAADPAALAALETAGRALGAAVLAVATLLDVDEVVLGGLLAQWFTHLHPAIDRELSRRRALVPAIEFDVTRALLGEDAILLGVIEFARRAVFSDPATVPPLPADVAAGSAG